MKKPTTEAFYPDCDYDVIPDYAFSEHNYPEAIVKRVKGQRYETGMIDRYVRERFPAFTASMLFHFAHEDGKVYVHNLNNCLGTVVQTGYYPARNPMTSEVHRAQALVVTLENGVMVPCTRLGPQNVIVQNSGFRSFIPKGAKVARSYF